MKKAFTLTRRQAFTLIELLIVIGIMAVIAAGVVALIDPVEKTRQANDANAQAIIGQYATALQSYAAQQSDGTYPTTAQGLGRLITVGELATTPTVPNGGYNQPVYSANATNTQAIFSIEQMSKKYTQGKCANTTAWFFFDSANGKACGACGARPALGTACQANLW